MAAKTTIPANEISALAPRRGDPALGPQSSRGIVLRGRGANIDQANGHGGTGAEALGQSQDGKLQMIQPSTTCSSWA